MKRGSKPTRKQKIYLSKRGVKDVTKVMVLEDKETYILIQFTETGETKRYERS